MSEDEKTPSARGFRPRPRVVQDTQPGRWAPGIEVNSKEDYDRFTQQLAQELLSECTSEHIAVVAAQHMMLSDLLSRALAESRTQADAVDARLELQLARCDELTKNWAKYTTTVLTAHKKKSWGVGGKKRHAETTKMKELALAEWDAHGANVSSIAAFARARHKDFGVTERTLYEWIRDYRKTKP